jgi:hypothetical protein
MAASETALANRALQKLGARRIMNLSEDSLEAREMSLAFAPVRDAELNRRRWRFSFRRESLPALAQAPDSDYARQFQLPGDFIRLLEGGDIVNTVDLSEYRSGGVPLYSIEGRRLLTDLPAPLSIRFVGRVTDTTLFVPAFDEAFASRLAYETCEKITQSTKKKGECLNDYGVAIGEARRAQALELPSVSIDDDTWLMARLG